MARKKPATTPTLPAAVERVVFATSVDAGGLDMALHSEFAKPFAHNGMVGVRRYRVTVALIDEPAEVIRERLIELWATSESSRRGDILRHEAMRHGLDLDACGVKRGERAKVSP